MEQVPGRRVGNVLQGERVKSDGQKTGGKDPNLEERGREEHGKLLEKGQEMAGKVHKRQDLFLEGIVNVEKMIRLVGNEVAFQDIKTVQAELRRRLVTRMAQFEHANHCVHHSDSNSLVLVHLLACQVRLAQKVLNGDGALKEGVGQAPGGAIPPLASPKSRQKGDGRLLLGQEGGHFLFRVARHGAGVGRAASLFNREAFFYFAQNSATG